MRVIPFLVSELRLPEGDRMLLGVEWWPAIAHAVIHRDGVFLFDTGVGIGNAEVDETFSPRVTPIEDALARHGIAIADVTGVANCHLHFDHSGQNVRLPPGVPIFVQEREWRMVHEPDYTIAEWIDAPHLSYEVLDGETEVAPGLRLVPTPGHAPGHQSLVIETPEGIVVLAGQAVRSRAEWDGGIDETVSGLPGAPDREAYVRSIDRLRFLDPIRVHFAHDAAIWQR
ncbi:MAG TPA: N-acyl homoserine lactonase family protein [Actinomycetota bacterium]|nr:N-acyl homoserine lactonase family protein [Actinomycetota bacterium]